MSPPDDLRVWNRAVVAPAARARGNDAPLTGLNPGGAGCGCAGRPSCPPSATCPVGQDAHVNSEAPNQEVADRLAIEAWENEGDPN